MPTELKYYHYTPEKKLEEIITSEKIKLASASVLNKKEKAAAWVSTNEIWEPTATKMVHDGLGNYQNMTFEQQAERFGCARIQVEPKGLIGWNKITHLLKMNPAHAEKMVEVGIEKGGHPSQWFGSLYPIGINSWIKAEVWRDGKWVEYAVFE